ncbi:MAG: flagellar biosynthesis protein FlhF [Zoogloeaceae bacterium]|jgi:flagellar biosynthesis protein FlhF|nr:flagellar biosynthesis protein FlhF [Zoogloeaceae bacterium]
MNVKKFAAANAREVLRKVKETLGQDAIILSNRGLPNGGVEIMAVAARDMASIASPVEEKTRPAPAPSPFAAVSRKPNSAFLRDDDDAYQVRISNSALASAPRVSSPPPMHASLLSRAERIVTQPETRAGTRPSAPSPNRDTPLVNAGIPMTPALKRSTQSGRAASIQALDDSVSQSTAAMIDEIRSLRKVIEQQLAGFVWGETARQAPTKTEALRRMLDAGFSPCLARDLSANLPQNLELAQAMTWCREKANKHLFIAEEDLIDRGGVYALTGPTGVGKTTTTAKLAARCVLRHGASKTALVTTDSYRIGAYEQLRIYGRILGVAVYLARDAEDLQQILGELSGKHMVLIDTMGMSQKDRLVAEMNAMLSLSGVRRLLLLSATARGDTLDDVVRAYRGDDLAGCVLTKIDEAATLAPAVDAIIRHGLSLAYMSNGQRVPEDLHLPNRMYLLHRAFRDAPNAAHRLSGLEPGLMMANSGLFATDTSEAGRG